MVEREICSVDKPFSSELIAVRAGKGKQHSDLKLIRSRGSAIELLQM